jgi:hypothetical protein
MTGPSLAGCQTRAEALARPDEWIEGHYRDLRREFRAGLFMTWTCSTMSRRRWPTWTCKSSPSKRKAVPCYVGTSRNAAIYTASSEADESRCHMCSGCAR